MGKKRCCWQLLVAAAMLAATVWSRRLGHTMWSARWWWSDRAPPTWSAVPTMPPAAFCRDVTIQLSIARPLAVFSCPRTLWWTQRTELLRLVEAVALGNARSLGLRHAIRDSANGDSAVELPRYHNPNQPPLLGASPIEGATDDECGSVPTEIAMPLRSPRRDYFMFDW